MTAVPLRHTPAERFEATAGCCRRASRSRWVGAAGSGGLPSKGLLHWRCVCVSVSRQCYSASLSAVGDLCCVLPLPPRVVHR